MGRNLAELKIATFSFFYVGRPRLFKQCLPLCVSVCIMERHHTGQEEKLIEVTMGMNGVEVSHQPRAQPRQRRSYSKRLVALASMLLLVIILLAGFVAYLVIFTPSCNLVSNTSLHLQRLPSMVIVSDVSVC